jgi:hypothetical protein
MPSKYEWIIKLNKLKLHAIYFVTNTDLVILTSKENGNPFKDLSE